MPLGAADRTLAIYWIDSEGGGSTLIVTPAGESVLIDCGHPASREAERVQHCARQAGLQRIDHLITTHFHIDSLCSSVRLTWPRWSVPRWSWMVFWTAAGVSSSRTCKVSSLPSSLTVK